MPYWFHYPKLFKQNLAIFSGLIGLASGSLTSANYYQKQIKADRKAFLECHQAWEKYYALSQENNKPAFNLAQQVDKKVKLATITKKLNSYGLEIEQKDLENLINHTFNQGIGILKRKIQELIPWTRYLAKYQENNHLAKEKEQERVYYSEVLPKCQEIKKWKKEAKKLGKVKKKKIN